MIGVSDSAEGQRARTGRGFEHVDAAPRPDDLIRSLDRRSGEPIVEHIRDELADVLRVAPGHIVLEAGCGTGDQAVRLAKRVGSSGLVVAIDKSEAMITAARARTGDADLRLEFRQGDATHLPIDANSVDRAMCDNLLVYLPEPQRAVDELVRVVRTGGWIVAFEPDFETMVIDHPDKRTTRLVVDHYVDSFPSGWIGRQLPRLFSQAGLHSVQVRPITRPYAMGTEHAADGWRLPLAAPAGITRLPEPAVAGGALSPLDAERWSLELAGRGHQGTYFIAITGFLVVGEKA